MSTLTGNQIKNTYQGLLKLSDSTTGITSNLQAITDGLGNNTGLRISTNQLEGDGIFTFVPLKAQYYGSGYILTNAGQYATELANVICAQPFYDTGNYSYSAVSIFTSTATSTSDTVEYALYTTQMINPFGIFPHTPIVSGMTADTTTQGQKTFVFPSHISFSGYGAGQYWLVFKITNSGVRPTWRAGQGFSSDQPAATRFYGNAVNFNGTIQLPWRGNNGGNSVQVFSGTTTFNNPFSTALASTQSSLTSLAANPIGFVLHTVDA
jgi:hypothetical protein